MPALSHQRHYAKWIEGDGFIVDFGLRPLTAEQSSDFYEVIIEQHRRASTIVTAGVQLGYVSSQLGHPKVGSCR